MLSSLLPQPWQLLVCLSPCLFSLFLCPEVAKADFPRSCLPIPSPSIIKTLPLTKEWPWWWFLYSISYTITFSTECFLISYSWVQASNLYLIQLPKSRKLVSLTLLFLMFEYTSLHHPGINMKLILFFFLYLSSAHPVHQGKNCATFSKRVLPSSQKCYVSIYLTRLMNLHTETQACLSKCYHKCHTEHSCLSSA